MSWRLVGLRGGSGGDVRAASNVEAWSLVLLPRRLALLKLQCHAKRMIIFVAYAQASGSRIARTRTLEALLQIKDRHDAVTRAVHPAPPSPPWRCWEEKVAT